VDRPALAQIEEQVMTLPQMPNTHDIVTMMGAISVSVFAFMYPDKSAVLWEIAGAYAGLNGGQMLGNIGQGAKRFMQGGTVAPLQIVAPMANKETVAPLAEPPGEK
jgi:hypothetical protein